MRDRKLIRIFLNISQGNKFPLDLSLSVKDRRKIILILNTLEYKLSFGMKKRIRYLFIASCLLCDQHLSDARQFSGGVEMIAFPDSL